jgi:hypothetical protein
MLEWLKLQLGLLEYKRLAKDILLCGKNGGKYNTKYFFMLETDEGQLILDRSKLKVMDTYSYVIESINYAGMDLKQFSKEHNLDLVETMEGLPR